MNGIERGGDRDRLHPIHIRRARISPAARDVVAIPPQEFVVALPAGAVNKAAVNENKL